MLQVKQSLGGGGGGVSGIRKSAICPFKTRKSAKKIFQIPIPMERKLMFGVEDAKCNDRGHCQIQLGSGGAVSPPAGPGQSPDGAKGAKSPEAPESRILWYLKMD